MTADLYTTPVTIPPTNQDGGASLLPWLREMREENPVWRDAYGVWHVFRYTDVTRVISNPQVFSSNTARVIPAAQKRTAGNLLLTDPPRHHTLRRLISSAFSPKVITGLAPRIAELTHELLDATDGAREFDLVTTLAYPLPVTVITALTDVVDPTDPQLPQKLDEATAELRAYLHEHCTDRRAHPRGDLISMLATIEADGQRLTDEEVVNFSSVLLIAGHITTTALLGNTVLCLDAHPQLWAQLHTDRSLVETTIEEVLRYRSPFAQLLRVTTAETELGRQVIPADALVSPWLLSANRDEREFPDPDRFDIHRPRHQHLAFGYGIHFCIGQLLARIEARVAIGVLLDHYTQIRLTPGIPLEFYNRGIFAARNTPITVRPRIGES